MHGSVLFFATAEGFIWVFLSGSISRNVLLNDIEAVMKHGLRSNADVDV